MHYYLVRAPYLWLFIAQSNNYQPDDRRLSENRTLSLVWANCWWISILIYLPGVPEGFVKYTDLRLFIFWFTIINHQALRWLRSTFAYIRSFTKVGKQISGLTTFVSLYLSDVSHTIWLIFAP